MRKIKLMALAAVAVGALAVPAVSAAAGEADPVVTAGGIKVKPCEGKDLAPLLVYVRGVDCQRALDLANEATSDDGPCPAGWHARHVALRAVYGNERIKGPAVYLCSQHSGSRAFTYDPFVG